MAIVRVVQRDAQGNIARVIETEESNPLLSRVGELESALATQIENNRLVETHLRAELKEAETLRSKRSMALEAERDTLRQQVKLFGDQIKELCATLEGFKVQRVREAEHREAQRERARRERQVQQVNDAFHTQTDRSLREAAR